jgi:large conductance mechanosensitive channel
MLKEFKAFLAQGDIVMLAVAVVIGLAFQALIKALVADILTPIIGIPGKANFATLFFTVHGSTFLYGDFLNAAIEFVSVGLAVFFFVVKPYNAMQARRNAGKDPETQVCPECLTSIPFAATRCSACTSVITKTSA